VFVLTVLTVLIRWCGPVSGARFNPVVSAIDWPLGRRAGGLSGRDVAVYTGAPAIRAIPGAVLANALFDLTPVAGLDQGPLHPGCGWGKSWPPRD
jgi:glycerol uptake facilitator-like aquaporin